jgi:hypothetical protein
MSENFTIEYRDKAECRMATTAQLTAILLGDRPDWLDSLDPGGRHALVPLQGIVGVRMQVRAMMKTTGSPDPLVRYIYLDWAGYHRLPVIAREP